MSDKIKQLQTNSFAILLLTDNYGNVLVQRSPQLFRIWNATAVCYLQAGEKPISAILEAAEEQLGIQAWELLYTLKSHRPIVTDSKQSFQIFTGHYTGDIDNLEICDDIAEVQWMSEREFERALFTERFAEYPLAVKKAMFAALYF